MAAAAAVAFGVIAMVTASPLVPLVAALAMAAVAVAVGRAPRVAGDGSGDLRAALGGLAVSEARILAPDASLVADLDLLAASIAAADRAGAEARRVSAELADIRARIEAAAGSTAVAGIERALAEAEEAAQRLRDIERAKAELPAIQSDAERLATRAEVAAATRSALADRLRQVGDGDVAEGVRRVVAARRLRDTAAAREAAADGAGDLESLLAEARSSPQAILTEEELAALDAHGAETARELERIHGRRGALETERRALAERPGVADAAGEAGALRERLAEVLEQRDRLVVAAAVLREAERRYREANAPRFVQRASEYLAAVTAGRYRQILLAEGLDGQRLELVRADTREPVPVGHPLSRGTIEQVGLALRLALVDDVDPEAALPLFLDESLVHWDESRLAAVATLLGAARGRQIVITTCHPAIAARLAAEGAYVIGFEGDGAAMSPARSSTATT